MNKSKFIIVAVDGGAAAGKSSTSRALSQRFGLMHVDTGSFYRATTLKLMEVAVSHEDEAAVSDALSKITIGTSISGNTAYITVDGRIPNASIRSQAVNEKVSKYAALPKLRTFLLDYQRSQVEVARTNGFNGLIMEGRDIGSVIFPNADLRLYLFADPAKRAQRRAQEGISDSIKKRDQMDSSRKTAPLQCPEGANLLDSSDMSLDEVVEKVSSWIEEIISP